MDSSKHSNFSPLNHLDPNFLKEIFAKYELPLENAIEKKKLKSILIELSEFDGVHSIDDVLRTMKVDLSNETLISEETFNIFFENYLKNKEKKSEIFKNSFFSDFSKQISQKEKPNDYLEKQNEDPFDEIINIPDVDDILKETQIPDIDEILHQKKGIITESSFLIYVFFKKEMEKNNAIIDFNQEKEKTDEAFESLDQKEILNQKKSIITESVF